MIPIASPRRLGEIMLMTSRIEVSIPTLQAQRLPFKKPYAAPKERIPISANKYGMNEENALKDDTSWFNDPRLGMMVYAPAVRNAPTAPIAESPVRATALIGLWTEDSVFTYETCCCPEP